MMRWVRKIKRKIVAFNESRYLKKLRKRNKNQSPTIITNNCIGGVIYHNLGLKFNSPTINLSIPGADFFPFAKDLEYYCHCDVQQVNDDTVTYPVGRIVPKDDDHKEIRLNFMHYKTFENAKQKWIERVERIDFDNIFFICEVYRTKELLQLLQQFDELPVNKMIITRKYVPSLKNQWVVSCYKNDDTPGRILKYRGLSGKRYLEQIDYVSFLNKVE